MTMTAIVKQNEKAVTITPMDMLQMAVQQNADLDKLQQLMDLQERWEKNEARKAFVVAMTAFKENPPALLKNKQVSFESQKGVTEYKHAALDQVSSVIGKALSAQGITHRWDVEQIEGGIIRVTCVLTHRLGHSERVPMQSGADQSGGKNNIQAIGSAVTYLQRYTLLAATGLATKDMDTDGIDKDETITDEQAANLQALIEEVKADKPAFLRFMGVTRLDEIGAKHYTRAVKALEKKRSAK